MICNKETHIIVPKHVATHSISMTDYKTMFPDAPIMSEEHRAERSLKMTAKAIAKGQKIKVPVTNGVECAICSKVMNSITKSHLRTHGITFEEYKSNYPDAKMYSDALVEGFARKSENRKTPIRVVDENDCVECAICHKKASMITPAHLKAHNVTMREYMEKYPDFPIRNNNTTEKLKSSLRQAAINSGKKEGKKRLPTVMTDLVECHICNIKQKQITSAHLKMHNTTMAEYRNKFPQAKLVNKQISNHISDIKTGVYRGEEFSKNASIIKKKYYGGKQPSHLIGLVTSEVALKISRSHLQVDDESFRILHSENEMIELSKKHSTSEIAELLGVTNGHIQKIYNKLGINAGGNRSNIEIAVSNYIESLGFNIITNDRKIINPLELDIFIPEKNIAIEICGLYWHSDKFVHNNYHLKKMELCKQKDIKLFQIFEDELMNRMHVVKSVLSHNLGVNKSASGARNLKIKEISNPISYEFCEKFHIQGGTDAAIRLGAFNSSDELVAVMTFNKSFRFSHLKEIPIELTRFCTNGNSYPGIASKLFKYAISNYKFNKVISYADKRWSEGALYHTLGFELTGSSRPSYSYVKNSGRHSKTKFRKQNIIDKVEDGHLKTEREIMTELGFLRIYDCGHLRFEWKCP